MIYIYISLCIDYNSDLDIYFAIIKNEFLKFFLRSKLQKINNFSCNKCCFSGHLPAV